MRVIGLLGLALCALLGAGREAVAAAGGQGGQPFELRCNDDEFVVGVQGTTGWYVDEIFLFCATLNPDGSHRIDPQLRGQAGLPGNLDYSHMCDDGAVVTGLSGRAGAYVASIAVRCSPTNGDPSITTAAAGGTGGTAYGEFCDASAGRVAIGVRGRDGWWIDQVEIICGDIEIPPPDAITLLAPANEAPLADLSPSFAWHSGFATVLGVRYDLCVDVQGGGDCSAYFKQDIDGPVAEDGTVSHEPAAPLDLAGSTFGFWRVRACTNGGCTLSDFHTFLAPPGGNLAAGLCPTYQNPRCANCHAGFSHNEGTNCTGCHTGAVHPDTNQPVWLLAPAEQRFAGATCGEICRTVRNWAEDPNHDFLHHIETDPLIQWGFDPSTPMRDPQGGVVVVGEALSQQPAPLDSGAYVSVSTAWYRAGMPCDPENDDFGPVLTGVAPGMAFGPPPGWRPRPPKLPPPKIGPVWWLDDTTTPPDRSRLTKQVGLPPECERLIGKGRPTLQIDRLRERLGGRAAINLEDRERERLLQTCRSLMRR